MSRVIKIKLFTFFLVTVVFGAIFYYVFPNLISMGRSDGFEITAFFGLLIIVPYVAAVVMIFSRGVSSEATFQPDYGKYYLKDVPAKIRSTLIVLLIFGVLELIFWYLFWQNAPNRENFFSSGMLAPIFFGVIFLIAIWIPHDPKSEKAIQVQTEQKKEYYKVASWDEKALPIIRISFILSLVFFIVVKSIYFKSAYVNLAGLPAFILLAAQIAISIYQILMNIIKNDSSAPLLKRIGSQLLNFISIIIFLVILYYIAKDMPKFITPQ